MTTPRKLIVALLGVFIAGAVVGGALTRVLTAIPLSHFLSSTADPAAMAARIDQKYAQDYSLSAEEQAKTAPLVMEMSNELYLSRRAFGGAILATLDTYHAKIAEQMTPEHRALYEKKNAERMKKIGAMLALTPPPAAR